MSPGMSKLSVVEGVHRWAWVAASLCEVAGKDWLRRKLSSFFFCFLLPLGAGTLVFCWAGSWTHCGLRSFELDQNPMMGFSASLAWWWQVMETLNLCNHLLMEASLIWTLLAESLGEAIPCLFLLDLCWVGIYHLTFWLWQLSFSWLSASISTPLTPLLFVLHWGRC